MTPAEIRHNILCQMIVPIFPLPNVVLFPKTLLPLHVFEHRYRAMTREAIAGDGKIAIALLKEGGELGPNDKPALHEIACVGRVETYEELEEGKYNIVLAGLHRVRLVREVEHSPYRLAEVEVLEEDLCDEQQEDIILRRNRLGGIFSRYLELAASGRAGVGETVLRLGFEALVNMVATALNLPAETRQALLEMNDITNRCDALMPILQSHLETLILVRRFEHLKPEEPRLN